MKMNWYDQAALPITSNLMFH